MTNLAVVGVVGQVGCVTLVILIIALIGGLWLDNRMDSKPLFTLIFLAASIPISVVSMLWIVRNVLKKFKPDLENRVRSGVEGNKEENLGGKDA